MGPALISDHARKIPEDMIDHQYINILENLIIDNETGGLLEYRHLVKRNKHKNTWLKIFRMSSDAWQKG